VLTLAARLLATGAASAGPGAPYPGPAAVGRLSWRHARS
jgi:hypothetical protein